MKSIRIAFLVICVAAFIGVGCRKSSEVALETSNPEFKIELLFIHDSVKMYRFRDGGRTIYWADARGSVLMEEENPKAPPSYHEVKTVK